MAIRASWKAVWLQGYRPALCWLLGHKEVPLNFEFYTGKPDEGGELDHVKSMGTICEHCIKPLSGPVAEDGPDPAPSP